MSRSRITRRAALGAVSVAALPAALATTGEQPAAARDLYAAPEARPVFAASLDTEPFQACPGQQVQRSVNGGRVEGVRLQGSVSSGLIECRFDTAGLPARITLDFSVRTPRGSIVHVHDEGIVQAVAGRIISCCSRPELLDPAGPLAERPSLLVARIHLGQLLQGHLELIAYEVMH